MSVDDRQAEVAVGGGAPVAGHVLHDGEDPAGEQPISGGAAERRHQLRVAAERPVANRVAHA